MQQLTLKGMKLNGHSLLLEFDRYPKWDEFESLARGWLQDRECRISEVSVGMDHIVIAFDDLQNLYALNFEHYTDSIWVESLEQNAKLETLLVKWST